MTTFKLTIERADGGYIITTADMERSRKYVVEVKPDDIPKYKIAHMVGYALMDAIEFNNGIHILNIENTGTYQDEEDATFDNIGPGHIILP